MSIICKEKVNIPFQIIIERLSKTVGFIRKDMAIAISYKFQFIFQFLQIIFGVSTVYFIGKMLGASSSLESYGNDYFPFALVGLAVTSYLKAGLVTLTNNIRQLMNQGVLEAMCASPTGYRWLLFCTALWPFIFETIRVSFYFFVGVLIFGVRFHNANLLGAMITLFVTIPIFLMLGMISCSILILIKRGDPVNWIFTSASALLAGTMFPIALLPFWLQVAAKCLPLTHSLEAMRKCLLMGATLRDVYINLLALLIFLAFLVPTTFLIINTCMSRAKKLGTLSTY